MNNFLNPVDIANRACQHCGVQRIVDFNEDSLQAGEFGFNYDKLRRAELRRNVWQFSIRRAPLRPISTGTMLLNPALWSSTTVYGFGAIVSDETGYLWQSLSQDNTNNTPGNSSAWDAYCGPLSVQPFDTTDTTGYFTGELVYETPGDGSYSVYLSLQNNNGQDPRAPTAWSGTTQYSNDQVVLYNAAWAIGTTYAAGAQVTYGGINYTSLAGSNTGHEPDTSPTKWVVISATSAPGYYNSATAYSIGAQVTYLGLNYVCIAASTGNLPTNVSYWAAIAAGTYYVSLIDFNLNNDPSAVPASWIVSTSYSSGNQVSASNGYIYTSVTNNNAGNDPTLDNGTNWTNTNVLASWTTVDNFGTASDLWLQIVVELSDLQIAYPIGSGPSNQSQTRNAFRLPANFLRKAPQDPKAGSVSFLGAPTGLMYNDWNLEGDYLVSRESYPIVLRFVADVTNVAKFDDMFCEGLGARLAMESVERLTQSTQKFGAITAAYNRSMTEARLVNGIETGSDEPPEDDYITCRI